MRARATYAISFRFLSIVGLATGALGGCHHAAGKIMSDTTLLPYKAPDIDDITGIDPDDVPATPANASTAAGSAAAGGK
jgi:hypothetical protein